MLLHSTISQCDREIIDHYTALSYVWGNPNETGSIYVDGCQVTITATLDAALRDLRDPSRVLRIWADALCIDQSNLDERNSQVGLMAQIYETAHHTVIHLGSLTESDQTVLRAAPSNTDGAQSSFSTTANLITLAENGVLKRVWFTRVWVFQELILSKDPWVQCGRLRARWTDMSKILLASQGGSRELQMLADMNDARGVHKQRFIVHLSSRRGLGATDPRDMIFAHMSISSDLQELKKYVVVDYAKDCVAVYEDAARYLLENVGPEGLAKFLPNVARVSKSRFDNLASWVPDWSLPSANLAPMVKRNRSISLQLDPKAHYAFVSKPLVLSYIGYEVDTIDNLSLVFPDPSKLDITSRER